MTVGSLFWGFPVFDAVILGQRQGGAGGGAHAQSRGTWVVLGSTGLADQVLCGAWDHALGLGAPVSEPKHSSVLQA